MSPERTLYLILLALASASPAARAASNCSVAGTDAYRERGVDAALLAFTAARARPECAADGQLAFNHARTLHAVLDREGDDGRACTAAEAYAEAAADPSLAEPVRALAREGQVALALRCDAARAPIEPPPAEARVEPAPAASDTGAWILTAASVATLIGGGVAYAFAADELDTAEDARQRANQAARPPIDEAAYRAARRDYDAAVDAARTGEIAAWVLLGAGVGLGTWAVITWLDDDTSTAIGLHFDGPAVRVEGRF